MSNIRFFILNACLYSKIRYRRQGLRTTGEFFKLLHGSMICYMKSDKDPEYTDLSDHLPTTERILTENINNFKYEKCHLVEPILISFTS